MSQHKARRRMGHQTQHLTLIKKDDLSGVTWFEYGRLPGHDEHVAFTGLDGTIRLDFPDDFDVFRFDGVLYEVQGIDRPRKRAWVEEVREIKERPEAAGLSSPPVEGCREEDG